MPSIIAYRNPMEQWFWEGGAIYVLGVLLVFLGAYFAAYYLKQLLCKHKDKFRRVGGSWKCRDCGRIFWVEP